jgi:stage V sporulation protein R
LKHYQHNRRPLSEDTAEVLKHLHFLWGFDVHLDSVNAEGEVVQQLHCADKDEHKND